MYRASYCNVLMTNEMHNSYNQFLFHSFLSALHISKESSLSSSGARHNILYYTAGTIGTIVQASLVASSYTRLHDCTDCTKLCNTVYYAVLLMMND